MTTNHIERLDPALIRPGRVDVKELLGDATSYQARTLFARFYEGSLPKEELELLEIQIGEMASDSQISMATLQGHFIRNGAREAVEGWPRLVEEANMDRALAAKMPKQVIPSAAR